MGLRELMASDLSGALMDSSAFAEVFTLSLQDASPPVTADVSGAVGDVDDQLAMSADIRADQMQISVTFFSSHIVAGLGRQLLPGDLATSISSYSAHPGKTWVVASVSADHGGGVVVRLRGEELHEAVARQSVGE